jgi:hypothetical protein
MPGRQIGGIGTAARIVFGLALTAVGLVGGKVILARGQLETGFQPVAVILGLVAAPAACWRGTG